MEENIERTKEGQQLLADQLKNIAEMSGLFLAALKGFRRDLSLSVRSNEQYLQAEFAGPPDILAVPPLFDGAGFADLRKFLTLSEDAIDGSILVQIPARGPIQEAARDALAEELMLAHQNLVDVSDTARRLYECIQNASLEFDVFNTKNIEVGYPEANILFERDALNVAMSTARALGERAVRMDIDLMESKSRLVSGERKPNV